MNPVRRLAPKPLLLLLLAVALPLAACGPRTAEVPAAPAAPAAAGQGAGATAPAAAQTSAEGALPLPEFKPCASTAHPPLPARWEAVALMQDFFHNSFVVGKFVYDEGARAFRFSLVDQYGVEQDMLVTQDGKLYLLQGGERPTSCRYLTARSPYTMPSRDWLGAGAVCVGQAPILKRDQQWWKSPSGQGANWYWYDVGKKLPFRSMYYADAKPTTPVPIYEHFTFNYFPTFKEVPSTDLAQILAACQGNKAAPTATAEFSRPSIEPLFKNSTYPKFNAERLAQIEAWIPGLTACSSTGALPPPWPERLQATAFMTAVSFPPNPFPTRIYYDWAKKAQNTTLYYYPPTAQNFAQSAYLTGDTGYIAMVRQDGSVSSCQQVLPGPPVRNWQQVDGCECRAQIAPHTVLNPSDVPTKILWCPTDLAAQQVFWTWYSDTGVPIVFMQSNSSPTAGTGLNLADYYQWGPGSVAPAGTFDLPQACQGQPIVGNAFPKACNNCHLPLNPRKGAAKGM